MDVSGTPLADAKDNENTTAFEIDEEGIVVQVKKRRRRVSFANTKTVHYIPRNDEFETPPESIAAGISTNVSSSSVPTRRSPRLRAKAEASAELKSSPSWSFHDTNVENVEPEQSLSDMDTSGGQGCWGMESAAPGRGSIDSSEQDSMGPVHLWHISQNETHNLITNDDVNHDVTLDAATFSLHLSRVLDANTGEKTFIEQGTDKGVSPSVDATSCSLHLSKVLDAYTGERTFTERITDRGGSPCSKQSLGSVQDLPLADIGATVSYIPTVMEMSLTKCDKINVPRRSPINRKLWQTGEDASDMSMVTESMRKKLFAPPSDIFAADYTSPLMSSDLAQRTSDGNHQMYFGSIKNMVHIENNEESDGSDMDDTVSSSRLSQLKEFASRGQDYSGSSSKHEQSTLQTFANHEEWSGIEQSLKNLTEYKPINFYEEGLKIPIAKSREDDGNRDVGSTCSDLPKSKAIECIDEQFKISVLQPRLSCTSSSGGCNISVFKVDNLLETCTDDAPDDSNNKKELEMEAFSNQNHEEGIHLQDQKTEAFLSHNHGEGIGLQDKKFLLTPLMEMNGTSSSQSTQKISERLERLLTEGQSKNAFSKHLLKSAIQSRTASKQGSTLKSIQKKDNIEKFLAGKASDVSRQVTGTLHRKGHNICGIGVDTPLETCTADAHSYLNNTKELVFSSHNHKEGIHLQNQKMEDFLSHNNEQEITLLTPFKERNATGSHITQKVSQRLENLLTEGQSENASCKDLLKSGIESHAASKQCSTLKTILTKDTIENLSGKSSDGSRQVTGILQRMGSFRNLARKPPDGSRQVIETLRNKDSLVAKFSDRPILALEANKIAANGDLSFMEEMNHWTWQFQHREEDELCLSVPAKLQTLRDCLMFSCLARPQMELFPKYVESLQVTCADMKKNIAERKASPVFSFIKNFEMEQLQKLQKQFMDKYRLESREWLRQRLDYEKEKLLILKESKYVLMVETDAAKDGLEQLTELHERALCLHAKIPHADSVSNFPARNTLPDAVDARVKALQAAINLRKESLAEMKSTRSSKMTRLQHENQEACERLIKAKQKLKLLESRIEDLLHNCSEKMQGTNRKQGSDVNIQMLEDHVKEINLRNDVLQKLQLMQLKAVKCEAGKKLIELSYCEMVNQRFEFEQDGLSAEVKIYYALQFDAIETAFPFMNATLAFQSILACLEDDNLIQLGRVPQIVQRTTSLVGSLIDLLYEIKECRRSFHIVARFSLSDAKEQLQIIFLECIMELKVILDFDLSCIRSGEYPHDLKPNDVVIRYIRRSSASTLTEQLVRARIAGVKSGFGRLKNLCATVFELVMKDSAGLIC